MPVRPFFDAAAKANNVEIVTYSEPAMYMVDVTVRGRDRNSVSDVVDDLTKQGIIKDIDLNQTKYWQDIENGTGVSTRHIICEPINSLISQSVLRL